ncbi:hypothetical protein [Flavobacterium cheongpyeongense]|nr:hypothetical protein [Flavobacterium cheongpyeongense]
MNYKIPFQERARLSMEQISKQKGVTLEQARAQAKWLSENSTSKVKKKRI